MLYAKISNGEAIAFPYTDFDLKRDNPNVSFPADLDDETRFEYGMVPVVATDVPEGKISTGSTAELIEGVWTQVHMLEDAPPPPVPDRITSRQFKLQLLAFPAIGGGETLLDDVEAWIGTQSRAAQVAFENSGTFARTEPMMQAGFAALGFSEGQIDAFFTAASAL